MAENTSIEWCDHTFNPFIGRTKVSPGCDNCYAEHLMDTRMHKVVWGVEGERVRTSVKNWSLPLKWEKQAAAQQRAWECFKAGYPGLSDEDLIAKGFTKPRRPRVFCASLADVFDNAINPSWRADLFGLILKTPHLDWLLLTKRIGNVKPMLDELAHASDPELSLLDMMPLPNVWLGITVVNQEEADRDIPKLLAVPAKVRFLSMEPLLWPVDISKYLWPVCGWWRAPHKSYREAKEAGAECGLKRQGLVSAHARFVDWVIVGGESGPGARPMHPDWARSLRDQCQAAGVPFLFKQWGEWIPYEHSAQPPFLHSQHDHEIDGHWLPDFESGDYAPEHSEWHMDWADMLLARKVGKKAAGRLLDGRTWDEFPNS